MLRNLFTRATLVAIAVLLTTRPGIGRAVVTCPVGDCDGSGDVTVNELITLVNIDLGSADPSACPSGIPSQGPCDITCIILAVNLALSACPIAEPTPTPTPSFVPGTCSDPAVQASEPLCALDSAPYTCEFLDESHCLLPYPSSIFLKYDPTTVTGLRMNYPVEAMPVNDRNIHIDPTDWNTLDGFSPGAAMEAHFTEGVDPVASNVAPITNLPRSLDGDSPTVIIDAETGEHILHLAELDLSEHNLFGGQPTPVASPTPAPMLLMRPGLRLKEGTRYIVAMRNLVDVHGNPIQPRRAFQILRDQLDTPVQTINDRRPQMEDIFARLERSGVQRENLILAWDFVTASSHSLASRAIAVRDQGLAANGPGAPPFTITSVEGTLDAPYSAQVFRRIRGFYTVPLFVTSNSPPTVLNLDANGVPRQVVNADCTASKTPYSCCTGAGTGNCVGTAPFTVTIPLFLVTGDGPPRQGRPRRWSRGTPSGCRDSRPPRARRR